MNLKPNARDVFGRPMWNGMATGWRVRCDGRADNHGRCEACGATVATSDGRCSQMYGGVDAVEPRGKEASDDE